MRQILYTYVIPICYIYWFKGCSVVHVSCSFESSSSCGNSDLLVVCLAMYFSFSPSTVISRITTVTLITQWRLSVQRGIRTIWQFSRNVKYVGVLILYRLVEVNPMIWTICGLRPLPLNIPTEMSTVSSTSRWNKQAIFYYIGFGFSKCVLHVRSPYRVRPAVNVA